jgi:hypothetical protein
MSKRQIIMLFGALIIIIALFSGLPNMWNTTLLVLIGISTIGVAYTTKPSFNPAKKNVSVPYVETKPTPVVTEAPLVPPLTVTGNPEVTEIKSVEK